MSSMIPFGSEFGAFDPFREFRRAMRDLDRFIDVGGARGGALTGPSGASDLITAPTTGDIMRMSPSVDVTENDGEICMRCDLPGMSKADCRVNITADNVLTIR